MNAKQRRKWKRRHREEIKKIVQYVKNPEKLKGDKSITEDGYLLIFGKEMSKVDCVVFLQNHKITY